MQPISKNVSDLSEEAQIRISNIDSRLKELLISGNPVDLVFILDTFVDAEVKLKKAAERETELRVRISELIDLEKLAKQQAMNWFDVVRTHHEEWDKINKRIAAIESRLNSDFEPTILIADKQHGINA